MSAHTIVEDENWSGPSLHGYRIVVELEDDRFPVMLQIDHQDGWPIDGRDVRRLPLGRVIKAAQARATYRSSLDS